MPPPRLTIGEPPYGQPSNEQGEMARPRHFVISESFGTHRPNHSSSKKWDVNCFLKNGGQLFYCSTHPQVTQEWIDPARGELLLMGCTLELQVRVTTRAMKSMCNIWLESTHVAYHGDRLLVQINWDECRDVFYVQYFSSTVQSQKKMEFLVWNTWRT